MSLFELKKFVATKIGEDFLKKYGLNRSIERLIAEHYTGRIRLTRKEKKVIQMQMISIFETGMIHLEIGGNK